jgi:hypothetical protein
MEIRPITAEGSHDNIDIIRREIEHIDFIHNFFFAYQSQWLFALVKREGQNLFLLHARRACKNKFDIARRVRRLGRMLDKGKQTLYLVKKKL